VEGIHLNEIMISQLIVLNSMLSDLDETGTTVLEIVKCGANLVSDRKVVFSQQNQCDQDPDF